jgi:hypothetical protein
MKTMKLKDSFWLIVPLLFIFSHFSLAQSEILPPPSEDQVSFDNPLWTTTEPSLITRISYPFSGIKLDCTKGKGVVYSLTLPNFYQGKITFEIKEDSSQPGALNYVVLVREKREETILNSLDIGVTSIRQDYNGNNFSNDHYFYSTALDTNLKYIGINTFVKRNKGGRNIISFVITPAGAYGIVNGINLAYLPSNKDDPQKLKAFYPVAYNFNKFNYMAIACPWAGRNTPDAGYLLVKNPKIEPISPIPNDRREVFLTVAKNLLENFPPLPTGSLNEIPAAAFSSTLRYCDNALISDPAKYNSWIDGINSRIHAIKALALGYLYPKSEENYKQIKTELSQSICCLKGEKGITASTLALAYWVAANKYPEKLNELKSVVDSPLIDRANTIANNEYQPVDGFISRSGGDVNLYKGVFLAIAGEMYQREDWEIKGKCLMFHGATRSKSETPIPPLPGCNYQTKVVWNGRERETPEILDAKNYLVDIGPIYDGRYDNHNYAPNPTYIYGANLGERLKWFLAYGGNKTKTFDPTLRHALDALWSQNLPYVDFRRNLWNSENISLLKPKNTPVPSPSIYIPYFDNRQYCTFYYDNFKNLFKLYSKSENFIDPANSINGLILGALYKNNLTLLDPLIKFIWYIGNDYGIIPYDPSLENIHPGFWEAAPHNTLSRLIYPATSLERYVLVAMALDEAFTLIPIPQIKAFGDLNQDGKVDGKDVKILLSKYLTNESDLNSDGKTNLMDLAKVITQIGN